MTCTFLSRMTSLLLLTLSNHKIGSKTVIMGGVFRTAHLVPEGSEVELVCSPGRPWFLCIWRSPLEDKQCALSLPRVRAACENSRLIIGGTPENCTLSFTATTVDHGMWTCVATLDEDFGSEKLFVDLQVSVRPEVHLAVIHDVHSEGKLLVDGGLLVGDLDTSLLVRCSAARSHPRPRLSWVINTQSQVNSTRKSCNQTLVPSAETKVLLSEDHYWSTSLHFLSLNLSESLNNSHLYCTASQMTLQGEELWRTTASTKILVLQPSFAMHRLEETLLPLLILFTLSITGCFLLILVLPLCCTTKPNQTKRRVQRQYEQGQEEGVMVGSLYILNQDMDCKSGLNPISLRYFDQSIQQQNQHQHQKKSQRQQSQQQKNQELQHKHQQQPEKQLQRQQQQQQQQHQQQQQQSKMINTMSNGRVNSVDLGEVILKASMLTNTPTQSPDQDAAAPIKNARPPQSAASVGSLGSIDQNSSSVASEGRLRDAIDARALSVRRGNGAILQRRRQTLTSQWNSIDTDLTYREEMTSSDEDRVENSPSECPRSTVNVQIHQQLQHPPRQQQQQHHQQQQLQHNPRQHPQQQFLEKGQVQKQEQQQQQQKQHPKQRQEQQQQQGQLKQQREQQKQQLQQQKKQQPPIEKNRQHQDLKTPLHQVHQPQLQQHEQQHQQGHFPSIVNGVCGRNTLYRSEPTINRQPYDDLQSPERTAPWRSEDTAMKAQTDNHLRPPSHAEDPKGSGRRAVDNPQSVFYCRQGCFRRDSPRCSQCSR